MSEDLTPDDVRQLKIAMRGLALLGLVAMIIAIARAQIQLGLGRGPVLRFGGRCRAFVEPIPCYRWQA